MVFRGRAAGDRIVTRAAPIAGRDATVTAAAVSLTVADFSINGLEKAMERLWAAHVRKRETLKEALPGAYSGFT